MHCHTDGPLSFGIARVGFFTRESWVTILAKCTVNVQVRKVGQGRSEDPKTKSDQIKLQTMLTAAESSCAPHQLKDLVSFGVSKVLYFVREKSHMKLRIYGSETLEQNLGQVCQSWNEFPSLVNRHEFQINEPLRRFTSAYERGSPTRPRTSIVYQMGRKYRVA